MGGDKQHGCHISPSLLLLKPRPGAPNKPPPTPAGPARGFHHGRRDTPTADRVPAAASAAHAAASAGARADRDWRSNTKSGSRGRACCQHERCRDQRRPAAHHTGVHVAVAAFVAAVCPAAATTTLLIAPAIAPAAVAAAATAAAASNNDTHASKCSCTA